MKTFHSLRKRNGIIFFLLYIFLVTVITGCATTGPTYTAKNDTTPPQASIRSDFPALSAGKARIIFYRPSAFFGFAMKCDISVDGRKVGESRNGTVFYVDLAPGKHKVQTDVILMYPGEQSDYILLRPNQTIYVKTSVGGSSFVGRTNIDMVSAEQAKEDGIDNLKFMADPLN